MEACLWEILSGHIYNKGAVRQHLDSLEVLEDVSPEKGSSVLPELKVIHTLKVVEITCGGDKMPRNGSQGSTGIVLLCLVMVL